MYAPTWFCLLTSFLISYVTQITGQQALPFSAKVLIYSATAEFRHDSIPTAIQALKNQGSTYNIQFDNTEDQTWFKDGRINQYDALLFLDNTGQVLDDSGEASLQNYVNLGGNFVGVHSASDCQRNSTFYEKELGAHFDYHPEITNATVDVVDSSHPSTSMLPAQWRVFDEMYNFKSDPRSVGAIVILSADESSYTDPGPHKFNQGTPHPTAWFQEHGAGVSSTGIAGRSFYTSLGHTNATWMDDLYLAHVMGGIAWALLSNTTKAANASALVGSGSTPSSGAISSSAISGTASESPFATQSPASSAGSSLMSLWVSLPGTVALLGATLIFFMSRT